MRNRISRPALGLTLLLTAVAAQAQQTPPPPTETARTSEESPAPRRRLRVGVDAGVFLPASARTRDRFGDSWVDFGLGFGGIRKAPLQGVFAADFSISYQKKGDNHAFLAPVGIAYYRAFNRNPSATPFAGASAGLNFVDLRSDQDRVSSGFRTGVAGSVFGGVTLGETGFVQVGYKLASRVKGFDLSGAHFTAGVRF